MRHKGESIAKVMSSTPPIVTFRRDLLGPRLASWNALLQRLSTVHLSQEPGEFRWNLHSSGKFTVDSMYKVLIQPVLPVDDTPSVPQDVAYILNDLVPAKVAQA